ncbi:polysaccharide pyruvyl transferase family protein [Gottfriedia acidiceleris]|uniref:polysaccharide pyruvyl transferase family protein n=1 Tax=Gottfriedia acidiceleris TaxID=371036 RepID=UPI002FFDFC68
MKNKNINKLFPIRKSHLKILFWELQKFLISNPFDNSLKERKKFFIFDTPTHGNLGDQAIAYAQQEFFKKYYPDYEIIEIPHEKVITHINFVNRILNDDDIIFIHGGGNIGDLYIDAEIIRRKVIKTFRKNKVIQLPQSFTFTKSKRAEKEKLKSKKIYGLNKENLTIVARETRSSKKLRELFIENKQILVPDIVLSINKTEDFSREGILFCLRSDEERVISMEDKSSLINRMKQKYSNVNVTDTVVDYRIYENTRYDEINKKWNEFRKSKVVITDRLHGMIFAVITGTPCIVFDNFNKKIQKTYQDWLQECSGIKFVDVKQSFNLNNIETMVENVMNEPVTLFDTEKKYDPLFEDINLSINKEKIL